METENELETRNKKPETKKGRGQFMLYAPLLIWIGVIFLLSSSQGSSGRTSLIIRPILEFLFPSAPEETLLFYHGLIRKCAHFTEYAVLGLFACRAFRIFASPRVYLASIALVCLTASLDEFNQSFNPLRTGSPYDVVIDLSGGVIASFIYSLVTGRRLKSSR
jgi:VanZ family protein